MNRIYETLNKNLIVPFLIVGLLPVAIVSLVLILRADRSLGQSSEEAISAIEERVGVSLGSIRDERRVAIERYFNTISDQIATFSSNPSIVEAVQGFRRDFAAHRKAEELSDVDVARMRAELKRYYDGPFEQEYQAQNGGKGSGIEGEFAQLPPAAIALQHAYIQVNPNPLGSKHELDAAPGAAAYHERHAGIHPWVRSYLDRFGYYDIFLVDPDTGDIVYSVFKELDYATSLSTGPYASTNFGRAFQRANALTAPGQFVFEDFEPYKPSYSAPASFIAAPIFDGAEKVGVAIFQMPLDRISAVMASRDGLGERGEVYLVGSDGLMRSDSFVDPEHRTVVASFRNPDRGRVTTSAVEMGVSGESGVQTIPGYAGQDVVSAFGPVDILGSRWAVLAELPTEEAFEAAVAFEALAAESRRVLLGWVGAVLVIASVGIVIFGRGITASLKKPINEMLRSIDAAANGDLTDPPRVESRDEIGMMAIRFGELLSSLRENIGEIRCQGTDLTNSAGELSGVAGGMADEIARMNSQANEVAGTADQMTSNMTTVAAAVEESTANIRNVAAAVEEMSSNLSSVSENVEGMAGNVNAISTRVEGMSAGLSGVTESSQQAATVATRAAGTAQRANETVAQLGDSAQEIGKVVGVINDIAEQTNLLALNATIEAASAGEAGRGFAVVANEVKELAKQTASATDEIRGKIEDMQESTQGSVKAIQEIVGIIDDINSISQEIASAVSDQRRGAEEIAGAVAEAASAASVVNENVRECSEAASEVARNAEELSGGSNEIARSAAEASSGAGTVTENMKMLSGSVKHTAEGAGRVETASEGLSGLAQRLQALVEQFRV